MKQLKDEQDMGMLLITHDLGVVAELCDRVVVMYAGRVVEEASVQELFARPQHPYTKGLIQSVPKLRQNVHRLESIKGMCQTFHKCLPAVSLRLAATLPWSAVCRTNLSYFRLRD